MRPLALMMLFSSTALAAGFELADQSVQAAGTGGAAVARDGDPAAVWYNPAALADGRGWRGGAALFLAIPRIAATSTDQAYAPTDQSTNTDLGVATPFALHLGYARGRFAGGLYAGTSHGSSVSWPSGWWGRFDAVSSSVRVLRIAPSFAVAFGRVRVGVGVHVDWGSMEIRRKLDFIDEEGDSHLRMSGASAGADASLYVQATDTLSLGLSYQSRTLLTLSGEANFTVPPTFAGRAPDQRVSTEMTLPDRFALGAAWRRGRVGVFGDVTLSLWSVRDAVRINFEKPETSDVVQPQGWRESFSLRAGAEWWAHRKLAVRGGAYYDHQAAPDQTLAPSSPDMARVGLTIGGSWQIHPALAVDLSYALVFLLPRGSTSDDAIPASYSGQLHMLGIAFRGATPRPSL